VKAAYYLRCSFGISETLRAISETLRAISETLRAISETLRAIGSINNTELV